MIEFLVLGEVRMVVSRTAILDLQAANFFLFKRSIHRVPWEAVPKSSGRAREFRKAGESSRRKS